MKLIANCQLMGSYGTVSYGDVFEADDEVAQILLKRGNARKVIDSAAILYETQVIEPQETPEVRPETPFRDVHVPDKEPPPVAKKSNPKLSRANVSKKPTRTPSHSGRRGRS